MIDHERIEKLVNTIRANWLARKYIRALGRYRVDSRYGFIYIMCNNEGIKLPRPCPPRKAFELYEKFTGLGYDVLCAHWFHKKVPKYAQNKEGIDDYDPEDMKWMNDYISSRERSALNQKYEELIKGKGTCGVSVLNTFFVIEENEFNDYDVRFRMEIDGNESRIARIRERLKTINGEQ